MAINVIKKDALDNKNESIKASSLSTQCQRVANVALPFLAMYKPFGFAVGVGSGAMRVLANVSNLTTAVKNGDKKDITFQVIQTAIAVASIASTLIAHPVGMLITTVNDVALDAFHMIKFIKAGDYQKAAEKGFSILSNAVYLGVMLGGGIELSIASIALQILNGIYQSRTEFMKGNYLEAFGHVAMVGIKSHQMAGQIQTLQSKWKFEALLKELSDKHKAQESQTKPTKKMLACVQNKQLAAQVIEQKQAHEALIASAKSSNNQELVEILIEYGNNPLNYPAIAWATHLGHIDVVQKLINYGADYKNVSIANVGNLLDVALLNKHLNLAEFFIENGIKNCNAGTHLKEDNNFEVWNFLERHNFFKGYKHTNTLAWFLKEKFPFSGIKFLIEHGADCSSKVTLEPYKKYASDEKNLPGLLTIALENGIWELEHIKFLIDKGAPINTNLGFQTSWNPLSILLGRASFISKDSEKELWNKKVAFFIEHGALWPNDGTNHSMAITLVSTASSYQNLELILLMSKICNCLENSSILINNEEWKPGHPTHYLLTPLQYAVYLNRIEDVKKLLKHGADPNNLGKENFITNNNREKKIFPFSSLAIAIKNKSAEVIDLLIQYGSMIP
jgi:ankyrin repeat protein